MRKTEYWQAVQTYCTYAQGSVDSWGRTPEHSVAVGGLSNDSHTEWLGVDVIYTGPGNTRLPRPAIRTEEQAERYAAALGLRIIHESDHDHVQPSDWTPPR